MLRPGWRPPPALPGAGRADLPLAAEADAIVVSNVPDDERWHTIVEAHGRLHPGVPVCVEPRGGPAGRSRFTPAEGGAAVVVTGDEDPHLVVALVDKLAARHRGR